MTVRDSDTPEHKMGELFRELQELRKSSRAHADEMREWVGRLDKKMDKGFDALKGELNEKIVKNHRQVNARITDVTKKIETVEANDKSQEAVYNQFQGWKKGVAGMGLIVVSALIGMATWSLTSDVESKENDREHEIRLVQIEESAARHEQADDREHTASRTERTNTARALDRLTGAIESQQQAQQQQADLIERRLDRLDERIRRMR